MGTGTVAALGRSMVLEGRRVLRAEAGALLAAESRMGAEFDEALWAIKCVRILHITGVGKSGDVGRKIAATFTSLGTPTNFLCPVEAVHGGFGIVMHNDGLMAISRSGECEETLRVVRMFRGLYRHTAKAPFESTTYPPVLALTGNRGSTLAKLSDVVLDCQATESDPDGLAPTSSSTVTQAVGHALALCLKELRGFKAEDFRRTHPGGHLTGVA